MGLQYQKDEETQPEQESEDAEHGPPVVAPVPIFTFALLGCIAAVMLAQFAAGIEPSIYQAGFVKQAFLHDGEYWRILTGATMHAGLLHVGMNGYALYSFGRLIELLSNRAHLAIVFLISAVGGGVLSLIFVPEGISVGASGGIVGLIGYLAVYAFRRRAFISAEFRKSLLINIGFILVFGLVLYQVIDNFWHIGGLITGAVYGFIQIPGDEYVDPRTASSTTKIAGYAALGIYIAASILSILLLLKAR
jgi:membrane associated rhomboid family serine protease